MRTHHRMNRPHFRRRDRRTGRIRRRRNHHAARVRPPMTFHKFRGQLIVQRGTAGNQPCRAAIERNETPVARIGRVGHQPLVTRIDQGAEGDQHRTGRACGHGDARRRNLETVVAPVVRADRLAQRLDAERNGVVGVPAPDRSVRRVHHRRRRGEVRLADIDRDDRAALTRKRVGLARDLHRVERFDVVHAGGGGERNRRCEGGVHGGRLESEGTSIVAVAPMAPPHEGCVTLTPDCPGSTLKQCG